MKDSLLVTSSNWFPVTKSLNLAVCPLVDLIERRGGDVAPTPTPTDPPPPTGEFSSGSGQVFS